MRQQSGADWLAWALHFIWGFVVGAIVGFLVGFPSRRGSWLGYDYELILHFILGFALIGGGFGSRYGDRLWLNASRQSFLEEPQEPKHSAWSELISAITAGIGVLIVVIVICKRFRLLD